MRVRDAKLSRSKRKQLEDLAQLIRYWSVVSTTEAGSGHPTTAMSATDLMTTLVFGGFYRFDVQKPNDPNNDRLVFSKGHASPLLYGLYGAAGAISEREIMSLRKFGSRLEGHPAMTFPYTEAATGSLGQGLSVGVGMALNAKYVDKLPYMTYVLLGDSEMTEGQVAEAMNLATHYKLGNLVGILDVNRLGQRGPTMYGHRVAEHERRIKACGWRTITVDGHSIPKIFNAYKRAVSGGDKPTMIIAKTLKGKGVSFVENKDGWHGKPIPAEELQKALDQLGPVNKKARGKIAKPPRRKIKKVAKKRVKDPDYSTVDKLPTRKAYGNALARLFQAFPNMVVLDAETSNSTYTNIFQKAHPDRFFEMFIAEQNMVSAALGLARRDKLVCASSFAAFLSRACDQIRMAQYAEPHMIINGSHAGVAIGQDGPSQMALEDIAMFRSILDSIVLYPSDAYSAERLTEAALREKKGIIYIRTSRNATPVIYRKSEKFKIGGSKTVYRSKKDQITVVAAGITLHETLKAYEELKKQKINIRVIDLYSVKPIDKTTLRRAARETKGILTVEDHFREGGIGEAVRSVFEQCPVPIVNLAVHRRPTSGSPGELLDHQSISARAIVPQVLKMIGK
ncbi:transketolase [candidate division GN15 bacterium]|nr:transketolase [candidate division GN15 bacterium]